MSTYLQLCQKFRKLVGISGSGPTAVTSQSGINEKITVWIADADEDIQGIYDDWRFLETSISPLTLTASQATYTLSSSFSITDWGMWKKGSFVVRPGNINYQILREMDYDDWLKNSERLRAAASLDLPTRVIIKPNGDIILNPTPNLAYILWAEYYKIPTRMSADASTSLIPTKYEKIILYRAKMYYAEHEEDPALYQSAQIDFQRELERLIAHSLPGHQGRTLGKNPDIIVRCE